MASRLEKEISNEELSALTSAIKTKYGIDFTNYEQKSLRRGFGKLIGKHEMDSLIDLWSRILRDREFFTGIIDDLTVNLTELFRNPEIWRMIKEEVLSEYVRSEKVEIWHAGCSTGEEVYSMAHVLSQAMMLHKASALATDLSSRALAKAMEGRYSKVLMKRYEKGLLASFPEAKFEEVFRINESDVQVRDRYRKFIDFKQHNLVSDPIHRKFDIIFCRNVMIYFDETLKMKVIKKFHEALRPGGFFIIGYYDMIPQESRKMFELFDATTRIYKKLDR